MIRFIEGFHMKASFPMPSLSRTHTVFKLMINRSRRFSGTDVGEGKTKETFTPFVYSLKISSPYDYITEISILILDSFININFSHEFLLYIKI